MIKLMVKAVDGARELAFAVPTVVIGRAAECDVQLADIKASRQHARLEKTAEGWRLTDLKSPNHTRLNGRTVETALINTGDEIGVGDCVLLVTELDAPPAPLLLPEPPPPPLPPPARDAVCEARTRRVLDTSRTAAPAPPASSTAARAIARYASIGVRESRRWIGIAWAFSVRAARKTPDAIRLCRKHLVAAARKTIWYVKNPRQLYAAARTNVVRAARETPRLMRLLRGSIAAAAKAVREGPERLKISRQAYNIALAVVLVAVGFVGYVTFFGSSGRGSDSGDLGADAVRAEAVLAQLRRKIEGTRRISGALIAEAEEAARAHGPHLETAGRLNPFDALVARLQQRRTELFAKDYAEAREAVTAALDARQYGQALALLENFRSSIDSSFEEAVRELVLEVDRRVDGDFLATMAAGRRLEDGKRYSEAVAHYKASAPRFQDTRYYVRIADKPQSLASLARAEEEALAAVRPPVEPSNTGVRKPEIRFTPPALVYKLIPFVGAGRFAGKSYPISSTGSGTPTAADSENLTVRTATGDLRFSWSTVPSSVVFRMALDVLSGDDLLSVADYAYRNGLTAEGDKLLLQLQKDGVAKAKIDLALAKARGLTSPPEGGYTHDPKYGWEDAPQRQNRRNLAIAHELLNDLVKADAPKRREPIFAKIMDIYDGPSTLPSTREAIRSRAVDVLTAWKKRNLESVSRKARMVSGGQVRALKIELNRRRKEALALIYDESVYLREDHPDWSKGDNVNGQLQVDRLVDRVREIWEKSTAVASVDVSIRRDIEEIREANEKYLPAFGEETDTDEDLKDLEEACANAGRSKLTVRDYCLNRKEAEILEWNRRVDRYNEACREDGVGEEEKAHAKVLNDYREMMGFKKLFLDGRLCKATKKHSAVCNQANRIWHVGSDGDPQSRANAEGFKGFVGENVALGYASPVDIWWRGWYRASDHHRNALTAIYNCMGYGYVGVVGTQNFSSIAPPQGF